MEPTATLKLEVGLLISIALGSEARYANLNMDHGEQRFRINDALAAHYPGIKQLGQQEYHDLFESKLKLTALLTELIAVYYTQRPEALDRIRLFEVQGQSGPRGLCPCGQYVDCSEWTSNHDPDGIEEPTHVQHGCGRYFNAATGQLTAYHPKVTV